MKTSLDRLIREHSEKFIRSPLDDCIIYHVNCLKEFAYQMNDGSVFIHEIDDGSVRLHLNVYNGEMKLIFSGNEIRRQVDSYEELEKIAMEYDEKVEKILKRLIKEKRIKMIKEI